MSLTMTRHHLLTPAAGLMPSQPSKKHHVSTLPMPVPTRKSAPAHHLPRARERDHSPEMLFDMSPAEGADAPIHYRALAAPPPRGTSPAPSVHSTYSSHSYAAKPFPINTKNRLSLVDASLAPIKTAPVALVHKNPEPFLYAFPTLSPAQRAPQSLPTRGRTSALRTSAARSQPHTPSPPFGRGPSIRRSEAVPATPPLTSAFRGALAPSEAGSFEEDFDDDELGPDAFFGSAADHWPAPPDPALSSVRQHELDRGRQRAPKHRRY
ncbi:hypothetical protein PENSPDRAFT_505638 [Peniophora sp. CONT]|nr:hypothetical protein PENSPDRAFT_505638 [Peniophora sp. CONT]